MDTSFIPNETESYNDLANILVFYSQAQTLCKRWHQQIDRWRELYDFVHNKTTPKENEYRFNDPTYTNTVDLAVGVLLANSLNWHAYGWSSSPSKTTSKIEKFLAGLLTIANEREESDVVYEAVLHFVRDGCGVIYSPWNPLVEMRVEGQIQLPDEEGNVISRRMLSEVPIEVKVIDPKKIFPFASGPRRWGRIYHVEKMTVYDVETAYGVKIERYQHLTPTDKLSTTDEFINYWELAVVETPNGGKAEVVRNAVIYGGQFIFPLRIMDGYEDLPFTIGFFKPVDHSDSSGWGHSILRPLETSVDAMERSVNRRDRQITAYSSLPFVTTSAPGRTVIVDPGVGQHVELNTGESAGFAAWPGNPPDTELHIQHLRSRIQQSGFSDVMFGTGASQVSGYAISLLGDQNRIRLTQPVIHLQLFFTMWSMKVLRLVKNFAHNTVVRVYGRMRGKDFTEQIVGGEVEGYRVRAEIKPQFPNEQVRKHAMATQVKGLLSDETIMERYLEVEQPDDEKEKRLQEMALSHPIMQTYLLVSTLQEMADEGDEKALLTLQAIQQQGLPGMPGRPKEPNAPEQLTGTASPNGTLNPAEGGGEPFASQASTLMSEMAGFPQMTTGGVG
jgi:hypothetical protein